MRNPTTRPKKGTTGAAGAADAWAEPIADLVAQATADAADRLLDMADGAERVLAKEARRALYVLRQAGVEPHPRDPGQRTAAPIPTAVVYRATASNVDGAGGQMLTFLREDPWGGSPYVLQFVINHSAGIQELFGRKMPRREVEPLFERMRDDISGIVVDIPVDYGRHLLNEATCSTRAAGRPLPQGYSEYAPMVGAPEREYSRPLIYEHVDADALQADLTFSHDAEHLLTEKEFRAWLPDLEAIQPWVLRYAEAGETRLVLADHQRGQLAERVVDDAADAILAEAGLAALRRRLEEHALVLHLSGHDEMARAALFNAVSLKSGISPHLLPFARAYVRRAIAAIVEMSAQEERTAKDDEDGSGLIWTP